MRSKERQSWSTSSSSACQATEIGTEVVNATIGVLREAGERWGARFIVEPVEAGAARYARTGVVYSEADFEICRAADVILMGALGLPDIVHRDGTEAGPDLQFRLAPRRLDIFRKVEVGNTRFQSGERDGPIDVEGAGGQHRGAPPVGQCAQFGSQRPDIPFDVYIQEPDGNPQSLPAERPRLVVGNGDFVIAAIVQKLGDARTYSARADNHNSKHG